MPATQQAQAVRPPMARGLPLFGSLFSILSDMQGFLTGQYLELGPVFRLRLLHRKFTVFAGPEANVFFNTEGAKYLRSREPWADMVKELDVQHTVASLDGPNHQRLRQAHISSSSRSYILENVGEVVDITRRDISGWPLDRPIPGFYTFQRIGTEQIGKLNTGFSALEYLDDLIVFIQTTFMVRLQHTRPALLLYTPRYRRARKRIDEMCSRIIAAHDPEQRRGTPPDLIDDLIAVHQADPEFLTEKDLKAAVLLPFDANLDGFGMICALMLYFLLKHSDLMERMTEEADKFFANGIPDADSLRQLDVTRRVAMETLRIYPPFPSLPRAAAESFDFGGYNIPEGELLVLATALPHQLPNLFPDPERFDIERYTPERMEHHQPGAYAPWGVGPHKCPGDNFAQISIVLTVATILHHLELSLDPPGYELKMGQGLGPRPVDSLRFRVIRRRN